MALSYKGAKIMIQPSDYPRLNELLSDLGSYIDPSGQEQSLCERAYFAAANLLGASPAHAAQPLRDLATKLREAAAITDEIAKIVEK